MTDRKAWWTPERRAEAAEHGRRGAANREQMRERGRRGAAALTPEQRREFRARGLAAVAAMSPEQRREGARKAGLTRTTHGLSKTGAYSSWQAMRHRCTNPDADNYPHYGGRGITICDRWLDSVEAFVEDMGPRPLGMTLDRIDVDGNYEPGNVRWATAKEQRANQRPRVAA